MSVCDKDRTRAVIRVSIHTRQERIEYVSAIESESEGGVHIHYQCPDDKKKKAAGAARTARRSWKVCGTVSNRRCPGEANAAVVSQIPKETQRKTETKWRGKSQSDRRGTEHRS